ncbi:MAG: DMT family transporter [Euryarchaeota archaeon]|nr:DMT family transporter [Euryarchaeota archaeon]
MTSMLAILLALAAMISWGIAPIIYKPFMENLDGIRANVLKNNVAALVGIALGAFYITKYPLDLVSLVGIVIATVMNVIIGDIFYMEAIRRGGVSIGTPVAYTFQTFVVIMSWLFLGEKVTLWGALGTVLVVLGIFLVSYSLMDIKDVLKGVLFGLITALIWAIGITIYGSLLKERVPPEILIFVRGIIILIIFGPLVAHILRRESIKPKNIIMLNIGGLFGVFIGSFAYYYAIYLADNVGMMTVISSASPALSIVLSQIIFKEGKIMNLQRDTYIGIALVVMGIFLTAIGGV